MNGAASPCSGEAWRRTAPSSRSRASPTCSDGSMVSARAFDSEEETMKAIMEGKVKAGRRGHRPLRRTEGRTRHAGDAHPHERALRKGSRPGVRPHHRRQILRAAQGASASATSLRKRPRAGPSASSRTATRSRLTSTGNRSTSWWPLRRWQRDERHGRSPSLTLRKDTWPAMPAW